MGTLLELMEIMLVPTNENKEKIKNMKTCGLKSEIQFNEQLKTQIVIMKNT